MPSLERIKHRLKNRLFRVDILTIFLVLLFVSISCIIGFTYSRNSKSLLHQSNETIKRIGSLIIERTDCLIKSMERLVILSGAFTESQEDLSWENTNLVLYLLDTLNTYQNLSAVFIGLSDGNLLEAINLHLSHQTHYFFHTEQLLPEKSLYAIRYVNLSDPTAKERWKYLDENYHTLACEELSKETIDPRQRPWYSGVTTIKGVHWTDLYHYNPTGEPGITVSQPLFTKTGQSYGVFGADLSLAFLGDFLTDQDIGAHGRSFILNSNGELIVSAKKHQGSFISQLEDELVPIALNQFNTAKKSSFFLEKEGTTFLVSCREFPTHKDQTWYILIIAPLKDFYSEMMKTQRQAFAMSLVILLVAGFLVAYFAKRISAPINTLAKEIDKIKQLDLSSELRVKSNIKEIKLMDSSIASMRLALRSFGKYVPKEIIKQLIDIEKEISLGGEKKEITIFFCDIAKFTSISETLPTELLMTLLAEYFDILSKIILSEKGTIDKYIGDSIMAFWGAPPQVPNHAELACDTALRCEAALAVMNRKRRQEGTPEFFNRIGIHSGLAIVGNIGTMDRMNYTVIGDTVNTASRLQTVNKDYQTNILITEEVYKRINNSFLVRPLDIVSVKGKKEKIKIFELVGRSGFTPSIEPTSKQQDLCSRFTEGYALYEKGEYTESLALFKQIAAAHPDDYPTELYIKKIQELLS